MTNPGDMFKYYSYFVVCLSILLATHAIYTGNPIAALYPIIIGGQMAMAFAYVGSMMNKNVP